VNLLFRPSLSSDATGEALSRLVAPGEIRDHCLDRLLDRLGERFRCYCARYSLGLWAPGLRITNEMRAVTELYLPMAEIATVFRRFLSLALRYDPATETTLLRASASWPDFLQRIPLDGLLPDPARLFRRLAQDEEFRIRFLFALFLPRRHGGSFLRYPAQIAFLESRLTGRGIPVREIRCLDAACGTGEGAYDLAGLMRKLGIPAQSRHIHGCSIEPLEIFAAAHGYFPHDRHRERRFREMTGKLFQDGGTEGMVFFRDDIGQPPFPEEEPYDIILCNGLLGGPFIHGEEGLSTALAALVDRLKPGGVLLAADRFHDGWKRKTPPDLLEGLLKERGLVPLAISDGFAAEKQRPRLTFIRKESPRA